VSDPVPAGSGAPAPPPSSALALLGMEPPWVQRFDDPAHQWRRLFAELVGTFLLVVAAAGGAVVSVLAHGAIGRRR
jgi:aquaporin Z